MDRAHEHTHHVWNLVRSSSFSSWQSFGKVRGGSDGECDGNSVENLERPGMDFGSCLVMTGKEAGCRDGKRAVPSGRKAEPIMAWRSGLLEGKWCLHHELSVRLWGLLRSGKALRGREGVGVVFPGLVGRLFRKGKKHRH